MSKNANNIPLGTFNPTFGGQARSSGSLLRPDYMNSGSSDNGSQPRSIEYHHESGVKRSHDDHSSSMFNLYTINCLLIRQVGTVSRSRFDQPPKEESREERRKKRKSRWEAETDKVVIPGMPTMIPAGLSANQEKIYLCKFELLLIPFYTLIFLFSATANRGNQSETSNRRSRNPTQSRRKVRTCLIIDCFDRIELNCNIFSP